MAERFRNEIDALEDRYFVGRDQEVAKFSQLLQGEAEEVRILNIYGTGGMGKSTLLDRFGRMAAAAGALFIAMDSRDFHHTPEDLGRTLYQRLTGRNELVLEGNDEASDVIHHTVRRINEEANNRLVILAFDTFEELGDLEHWLRVSFLPMLDSRIKLILAGRNSLKGGWLSSPAWRQVMMRMPLGQLRPENVKDYLQKMGFMESAQIAKIALRTKGHPLTLSLAAYYYQMQEDGSDSKLDFADESELTRSLAEHWLKEVPGSLRELTEAAAILSSFNRETLSAVLDHPVEGAAFDQLVSLSFVRGTERGWMFHDLMRDAVTGQLRLHSPEFYQQLQRRAIRYYYQRIVGSGRRESMTWEMSKLFSYLGDSIMRAYMHKLSATSSCYLEPLDESNLDEATRYLETWCEQTGQHREKYIDPESGEEVDLSFDLDLELIVIRTLNFQELLSLDPDTVRLYRSEDGAIAGFCAIIPIHSGTLEYLRSRPFSRAYFESRSQEQLAALRVPKSQPAGWVIRAMNSRNLGDLQQMFTIFQMIFALILRGGLVVTSPPPVRLFHDVLQGIGLEQVPGLFHQDYDGRTPTSTFVLDTRGARLGAYFKKLISGWGLEEWTARTLSDEKLTLLSPREQEVVRFAIDGLTNLELAERLFVSEVTIKKHLTSIFQKLGVKNRATLAKVMLDP